MTLAKVSINIIVIKISKNINTFMEQLFKMFYIYAESDLPGSWQSLSFRAPHLYKPFPRAWNVFIWSYISVKFRNIFIIFCDFFSYFN